jgi:hypothetical protein
MFCLQIKKRRFGHYNYFIVAVALLFEGEFVDVDEWFNLL